MKATINTNQITGKLQDQVYPIARQVGIPGPIGPVGIGINWLGEYSAATTYNENDAVSYNGSSYVSISTDPIISIIPTNDAYWDVVAVAGDDGTGDLNAAITTIAGEDVAPNRVVYINAGKVYLADKDNLTDRDKVIGITKTAAIINNLVDVYTTNTVTNTSWNWNPGVVYVDTGGAMTQTEPTSGFIVQVGVVVNATTIFIDIDKIDYIELTDNIDGGTF